jgi:hypothetical protein
MNFYRREGRFALCQECGALAPPVQGLGLPKAVVAFLNWLSAKDVIFFNHRLHKFRRFFEGSHTKPRRERRFEEEMLTTNLTEGEGFF